MCQQVNENQAFVAESRALQFRLPRTPQTGGRQLWLSDRTYPSN
jgi:hypothetical protein